MYLTESKIILLLRLTINFTKKEKVLLIKLWHNAFQTHQLFRCIRFQDLKI